MKVVIKDIPAGTKIIVYERRLWFWVLNHALIPLTSNYLIEYELERLKNKFGKNLIIDDKRIKQKI